MGNANTNQMITTTVALYLLAGALVAVGGRQLLLWYIIRKINHPKNWNKDGTFKHD